MSGNIISAINNSILQNLLQKFIEVYCSFMFFRGMFSVIHIFNV